MVVEFGLLGDVEVRLDGRPVDIGPARQQSVLAVLLVEANKWVSVDQLTDRVWGDAVPHSVRVTLRTYLSRLRAALAPIEEVEIVRRTGGYTVRVDPAAVDVHRFEQLVARARAASEDGEVLALLDEALGLWRGEAFANLDARWLTDLRAVLDQRRRAAELDRTDLLLRRGHHGELLAGLSANAAADPLDERLAGQLILALYLSGRQADALEHYERLRALLADELGASPGAPLRQLHQRILTADPTLAPRAEASGRTPTPRQLPAAPRLFTGREDELARLTKTVDAAGGGVMVISAIGGGGGVGKTWLAVCWAHQNLHRFPDGQLYVDLNGFDPIGEPLSPDVAVRGFLAALGVAPAAVPVDPQAGSALYRSVVAERRMLVVLDNARDTAQVTPLLPGGRGCVVLVTSRNQLGGLVTAHGAIPLDLDVLTDDEARRLLTRHVGEERVAAEPAAAAELLQRCAGLPLAIGIVAARAATTPSMSLGTLAEELRDRSARLDTITTGELATNLRGVFSGSYRALGEGAARMFRLLGLAQLPDVSVAAAASLAGVPSARVRGPLRELETAYLVQQHVPGRYRMHDLVRLYANECAQREESAHTDALRRLVDCYLHTAHTAAGLLYPQLLSITLDPPVAGGEPEPLADATAAHAWFDVEYACLVVVEQHAAQQGWDSALWQLAWSVNGFRHQRGYVHDYLTAGRAEVAAADRTGSPAVRAVVRQQLAKVLIALGSIEEAREHLTRGLALAETAGDVRAKARIYSAIAQTWAMQGNHREAVARSIDALELSRTLDSPGDVALMLSALGWFQAQLGEYGDARASCEAALGLMRELSYRDGETAVLDSLGYIAHHTGELHDALDHYREALDHARVNDDTMAEADILDHIGETYLALRQPAQARDAWRTTVELFRTQHRLADAERVQRRLRELP